MLTIDLTSTTICYKLLFYLKYVLYIYKYLDQSLYKQRKLINYFEIGSSPEQLVLT